MVIIVWGGMTTAFIKWKQSRPLKWLQEGRGSPWCHKHTLRSVSMCAEGHVACEMLLHTGCRILVQLTDYAVFILLLSYLCGFSSSRERMVDSSLVSPSLMKSFERCIRLSTSTHFVCVVMKVGNVCLCCTRTLNMHADGETWNSTEVKKDKTHHSPF